MPIAARRRSGCSEWNGDSTSAPSLVALSGPYRFYDWDWWGRALIRAYDFTLAPLTQLVVYRLPASGRCSTAATSP